MHLYLHHIGDFNSGTLHMERLERWIYRDMLEKYYDLEKPLPADIDKVCRLIGVRSPAEREIVIGLLGEKFVLADDGYHQSRCDIEIAKFHHNAELKLKASLAAKAKRDAEKAALDNTASALPPYEVHQESTWTPHDVHLNSNWTPNQEPISKNQEPGSFTPPTGGVVVGNAEDAHPTGAKRRQNANATPPCPHEEIVDLYHSILPMCPGIRDWTKARQAKLRARWNEAPERQNLDYWRRFFEYVATCDFLVGRTTAQGRKPFFATLHWMVEAENFAKIREGTYEQ